MYPSMSDNLTLNQVPLMRFSPWSIGVCNGGLVDLVDESGLTISQNCRSNVSFSSRWCKFPPMTFLMSTFNPLINLSTNAWRSFYVGGKLLWFNLLLICFNNFLVSWHDYCFMSMMLHSIALMFCRSSIFVSMKVFSILGFHSSDWKDPVSI